MAVPTFELLLWRISGVYDDLSALESEEERHRIWEIASQLPDVSRFAKLTVAVCHLASYVAAFEYGRLISILGIGGWPDLGLKIFVYSWFTLCLFCGFLAPLKFLSYKLINRVRSEIIKSGISICSGCGYLLKVQGAPMCPECGRSL